MIPFVIEMRGQAQVSSKQTAQTQKRLDELSKRRPEVHPAVNDLCTSCVQEGGFEGPENGPKQRRINNRLLSYRPQPRGGNRSQVSDCTVVQRISQLCGICASVQNSNFSGPLTVHDLLNQSSVYRGGSSPRSVKMYWLSQEVQCFRVDPINKQNHNAGRSKINT